MDHKEQYQSYLAQAMSALEHACAHFLPEESEVCRAARYSLMGGGQRIRAVLSNYYLRFRYRRTPTMIPPVITAMTTANAV